MYFILKNNIFDTIISIITIINIITTVIPFFLKSNKTKKVKKQEKRSQIEIIKELIQIVWCLLFIISITILAYKLKLTSYITILYYISIIFGITKTYKKNLVDLTIENKLSYLQTLTIFLIFFSNQAADIYIKHFSIIPRILKEYLLIIFLAIKLIFFIYCIVVSFSILLSNLAIIFKKQKKKVKQLLTNFLNKYYELNFYDFYFSKKYTNKFFIIIDTIIYIVTFPILIIVYIPFALLITFIKYLIKKFFILYSITIKYFNNSSKIIIKTLKFSTLISLVIIYIIITYNSNVFSANTKDIFSLLTTVILIPLIYDSIKSK